MLCCNGFNVEFIGIGSCYVHVTLDKTLTCLYKLQKRLKLILNSVCLNEHSEVCRNGTFFLRSRGRKDERAGHNESVVARSAAILLLIFQFKVVFGELLAFLRVCVVA